MDAYTLGLIIGAILQPSTILAVLLSLFFKRKRRNLILIIVFVSCILQWILSIYLGGGNLGIGSLAIPLLTGFIVVYFISFFKKKEINTSVNEPRSVSLPKIVSYPIYLIVFMFLLFMITPIFDLYENDIKPRLDGYVKAEYSKKLQHDGVDIDEELMMYIHYFTDSNIENASDDTLNDYYYKCIDNNKVFDVSCLKFNDEPFLLDDSCSWTFFGHSLIANYNDLYLVNIEEKACGTLTARFNSYYLFEYDGKNLTLNKVMPAGRDTQRKIKYYKIEENAFKFVTTGCFHGSDSCRGVKAAWLEMTFK